MWVLISVWISDWCFSDRCITGLLMVEPYRKIERHWPAFLSRCHYAIFIGSFPVAFLFAQQFDAWLGVDILTLMVLVGYLFPLFDLSARRARDIGGRDRKSTRLNSSH